MRVLLTRRIGRITLPAKVPAACLAAIAIGAAPSGSRVRHSLSSATCDYSNFHTCAVNYLLAESLERFSNFYADEMMVEYPRGSGVQRNLAHISRDLWVRSDTAVRAL